MKTYRYILEPYKGINSRYTCPACRRPHKFVRYRDTQTGEQLPPTVGRCDREIKCGYHYTVAQYLNDMQQQNANKGLTQRPVKKLLPDIPTSCMDKALLIKSMKEISEKDNNFITYLETLVGREEAKAQLGRYMIGTSDHWKGATIFWQMDVENKIRSGKIMLYNPTTGKRVKEPFSHIAWVHKAIEQPNFELKQCFFGEHLLRGNNHHVAIVESEKTAIIASAFCPEFIWLAAGSLNGLTAEKCKVLKGHEIMLFPDLGACDKWKAKTKEIPALAGAAISKLLENKAVEKGLPPGADLADYLIMHDYKTYTAPQYYIAPVPPAPPVIPVTHLTEVNRESGKAIWQEVINALETYFGSRELPTHPIKADVCSTITDVPKFIKSHLQVVKNAKGNPTYLPYLHRLQELAGLV